jgi:hypothetical protein
LPCTADVCSSCRQHGWRWMCMEVLRGAGQHAVLCAYLFIIKAPTETPI